MKLEKVRQSNIELLRIIVMMLIISCHFATHGGFHFSNAEITIPRLWWNLLEMEGDFGVDVFVIISGYFLIEDNSINLNSKKILRLWGQVFFYSITFFVISVCVDRSNLTFIVIIKSVFPITFLQWWFASTYFVLYLLHPFINRLLKSLTKKQFQSFLILLLIMWSVIPTFTSQKFQSNALIEFIMFYSIAAYCKLYGLNSRLKTRHYFALWMLFTGITYISSIVFIKLSDKIPLFLEYETYFFGTNQLSTLIRAVCFFMMFSTMKMKNYSWINKIASASFGVYLIHDSNFLRPYLWEKIFKNAAFQESNSIVLYSLVVVLTIYTICTIIDLLRQLTFEKIYMRFALRYYNRLIKPIEGLMNKLERSIFGNQI